MVARRTPFSRVVIAFFLSVVTVSAAKFTVSQQALMALNVTTRNSSVLAKALKADGVEYVISFSSADAYAQFMYSASFPLTGADTFGVKVSVLSTTADPGALLGVAVVINHADNRIYSNGNTLKVNPGETALIEHATDAKSTTSFGFMVVRNRTGPAVTQVRILVSPAPGATKFNFTAFTLTKAGIEQLRICDPPSCRYAENSSLASKTAREDGVEFLLSFSNGQATAIISSNDGPNFLHRRLSGWDTFRLQFKVLSAAPNPQAVVSVGALISSRSGGYTYTPVRAGGQSTSAVVSSTFTSALSVSIAGFAVSVSPSSGWPEDGGQLRLLVSPAPDAPAVDNRPTVTLTTPGLLELDVLRASPQDGSSVISVSPTAQGVEYLIGLAGQNSAVYVESSSATGKGALVGDALSGWDAFSLRFTLLPPSLEEGTEVIVGATFHGGFKPYRLGGAAGATVVAETTLSTVGRANLSRIGFVVYGAKTGDKIRLLVSPVPNLTPVCALFLSAPGRFLTAEGGAGAFSATSFEGCKVTASCDATWIKVDAAVNSNTSNSTKSDVKYEVSPNPTDGARLATIAVGRREFKVSQAGHITGNEIDPSGDSPHGSPDLVSASASVVGTNFTIRIGFAPGTFDAKATDLLLSLDSDQDPATGYPGISDSAPRDVGIIGSDYLLHLAGGQTDSKASLYKYESAAADFKEVGSYPAKTTSDGIEFTVPLSAIGKQAGGANFKVAVALASPFSTSGLSPILDVLPDIGKAPGISAATAR